MVRGQLGGPRGLIGAKGVVGYARKAMNVAPYVLLTNRLYSCWSAPPLLTVVQTKGWLLLTWKLASCHVPKWALLA
jgi:hypothetical protein